MQLAADRPHDIAQARLDVHVHVFFLAVPKELTALDLTLDLLQPSDDRERLSVRQHPGAGQAFGVRNRARDVLAPEIQSMSTLVFSRSIAASIASGSLPPRGNRHRWYLVISIGS